MQIERRRLRATGIVQGVGFRPFVFQQATHFGLTGWVFNNPGGVEIEVQGVKAHLDAFARALETETPPLARVDSLHSESITTEDCNGFEIRQSNDQGERSIVVPPDVAVCQDCLNELVDPENRRYRYPFINCTHCGPRYSIIKSVPYDRPKTTMAEFQQCPSCLAEYENPADRRFHAQPNACAECGPSLSWQCGEHSSTGEEALQAAVHMIHQGGVVAIKGLSGVHLVVDASNDKAVELLRQRKHRPEKPFAIMAPNMTWVTDHCHVSELEAQLLTSPEAPIVLLDVNGKNSVSRQVAPSLDRWGIMLPYTPLHHLLLNDLGCAIVATSGNVSGEPMVTQDDHMVDVLGDIADGFLLHNRPIHRPVDDSVLQVVEDDVQLIRLGRGFVPWVMPNTQVEQSMLAVGGHMKNSIALACHGQIIAGQFLSDLDTERAMDLFRQQCQDMPDFYCMVPDTILHDAHPDYASTRWAEKQKKRPNSVPHHEAHVAAVMLEHRLEAPLTGLAWDGIGYGHKGAAWGAETFNVGRSGFDRVASIRPIPLIGGDVAAREPRRVAYAMLMEAFGKVDSGFLDWFNIPINKHVFWETVVQNTAVRASSMGRLFDGMAALLGVCEEASFEGQSAMYLQQLAEKSDAWGAFHIQLQQDDVLRLDWRPMVQEVVAELEQGTAIEDLARRFHNTMAAWVALQANRWPNQHWVLSGGCFQNRLLLRLVNETLTENGFIAHWAKHLPSNDGSIAVGQIAWKQLQEQPGVFGCTG